MAQDRMIRAAIRYSEKVNGWPIPLRYFWTQLWGFCDDFGRGRYSPPLIKADTFPLDDEVTTQTVSRWMTALEIAGVVVPYEVAGKPYFFIPGWDENQSLRYQKKSDIPKPPRGSRNAAKSSAEFAPKGEGEIDIDIEGEGADARPPVDNSEPSLFCSAHPNGTTGTCGPCGDARRIHKAWERAEKNKPTPIPPRTDATVAHEHVWLPNGTCKLCPARALDVVA